MRLILIILISVLGTNYSYASCSDAGLSVFPTGKTIKQNTIFVLDAYSISQKIIYELNKTHDIYLKSGNKKVKLNVIEICVGQFNITQAILKPDTLLQAGLTYTFCIDNLPEYEGVYRYNSTKNQYETVIYEVVAGIDNEKPTVNGRPKEINKFIEYLGCGPVAYVSFSNPALDSSELIVKITVKNLETGKETTYNEMLDNKKINVGHGMCAGAFFVEQNTNFEVEFSFMDSSGNIAAWTGERIKFTKPICNFNCQE